MNPTYILNLEPTKFHDKLDVGYNRKRGGKFDFMVLGLMHCKVGKTANETDLKG